MTVSGENNGGVSRPCPVCLGQGLAPIGRFDFGLWDDVRDDSPLLIRRDFVYRLVTCDVCGHVMVAHDYGDDFVTGLYRLPQSVERWSADDGPEDAPYAEMIAFCGPAGLPDAGLIVDFGCGLGMVLRLLAARYAVPAERLMGVDFSPGTVGCPTLPVDLNRLESAGALPCDGYALAYCTHVLEHLFDPRAFLRSLRRRAGAGGLLYLEVPDHGLNDLGAAERANLHNAQHLHYFSLRTLRLLAEGCGWTVLRADAGYFGFTPRARLLLQAGVVTAVKEQTCQLEAHFADLFSRAAAAIMAAVDGEAPVALWGLGGDFFRMLTVSPSLAATVFAGRVRLIDQGLAGKSWLGVPIAAPTTLRDLGGEGAIFLLPRPEKTRSAMLGAAVALGVEGGRLKNPYRIA